MLSKIRGTWHFGHCWSRSQLVLLKCQLIFYFANLLTIFTDIIQHRRSFVGHKLSPEKTSMQWSGSDYSGELKSDRLKSGRFCPDIKWFLTKWQIFVWISDPIRNPDHLLHATQPLFDHSKSRLVRISDPHCIRPVQ